MKLLITGVPGTGKTTLGKYFESQGYYHYDMEKGNFSGARSLKYNPKKFVEKFEDKPDAVITWGFGFFSIPLIEFLRAKGFKLLWLDGDRVASFKSFMKRDKHNVQSEYAYYSQLMSIIASDIINRLDPVIVNPFNKNGQLRPTKEVANEILRKVKGGIK